MELAHATRVFFSIRDPTHKMSGFLKFPSKVHSLTFDASLKLSGCKFHLFKWKMNLESSVSLGADANPLTQKYTRKQKQKQHMAKKTKKITKDRTVSDLTLLASKTVSMACVHVLEVAMPTNIDVCPNKFGNMSDMCAQRFFSAIQTGVEAKLFL